MGHRWSPRPPSVTPARPGGQPAIAEDLDDRADEDYIKEPRSSGYRAIHHIVRRDGRLIEVQLRTVLQDAWANQVEEDSRRLATGYKFGRGGEDVHDYYRIVSEAFAALDRDEDLSPDLVAAINENYANVAETLQRRPPRGDR